MAIQIKWLGHSCFLVENNGYRLVLDPFQPGSVPGLPPVQEEADLVLCSHEHFDHNYREGIKAPETQLRCGTRESSCCERGISDPTENEKEGPFRVTALSSYHDDQQGALRGKNTIFLLEAEGMKLIHFGDIGCMPSELVLEKLRGADAVMIPVGGHYTVDAAGAKAILDEVKPRVTIPMHYRSECFGFDVLGTVDGFLELCGAKPARYDGNALELTPETPCQIALLSCPVEGQ